MDKGNDYWDKDREADARGPESGVGDDANLNLDTDVDIMQQLFRHICG